MQSLRNKTLTLLPVLLIAFLYFPNNISASIGEKAMVATAHPLATDAALGILKEGGNAVDAAVAAQWVLNVVEPHSSGIGGGGFFLYYEASSGRLFTFDGREKAPRQMLPTLYLNENGKPIPYNPDRLTGGHSVGVPGTLRLLKTVHDRFGSDVFFFSSLFEPAIFYAEKGFEISARLSRYIDEQKDRLKLFKASSDIFLDSAGNALKSGTRLYQTDLAETFRVIQRDGVKSFYEGEIAKDISECVRHAPYRPGAMTKEDLFYYDVIQRDAVHGNYRGYDVFSMGPPSSGGTTLIEALHILENFDIRSMGRNNNFFHLFAEAQKMSFQDRNQYVGDPGFSEIPVSGLLSKAFAKERSADIRTDAVYPSAEELASILKSHTSHISIVDEAGNMVSFTTTIEHVFGSAMVVPGRGFLLNNELSDFDANPWNEEKNLKPNAPESEKRPRSSMTPTFVFSEGKPILIVGSPGGSTIISTVLNIIVNIIDFGMSAEGAVRVPRILNRDGPTELETRLYSDPELVASLENKGHVVQKKAYYGNAQVIYFDSKQNQIIGVSDPRGEGEAAGY